jgi:hypothetical protein
MKSKPAPYRVLKPLRINGRVCGTYEVVHLRAEDAEDLIRCGYVALILNGGAIQSPKWTEPVTR